MRSLIALLPGDGIGPEVTAEGARVLARVAEVYDHTFEFANGAIGGAAIDAYGEALPAQTLDLVNRADGILLGAVGGPKWSDPNATVRPEQGLLQLRRALDLFANLRPVRPHPALTGASPIKSDRLEGVDILVVRELTGGLYFGDKTEGGEVAEDVCRYSVTEIERIVRVACRAAEKRRGRLTSVDKANVLATSRLWRKTVERVVQTEYPALELEHLLVDAASMHLIQKPASFDVMVTENLFGDILTDEASVLSASMGMLPSASLNADGKGLFEPIHGSAPDIAGQGIANPVGTIRSAAMLLRYALGLPAEADAVEEAVAAAITEGVRTVDIAAGGRRCATPDFTDAVIARIEAPVAA